MKKIIILLLAFVLCACESLIPNDEKKVNYRANYNFKVENLEFEGLPKDEEFLNNIYPLQIYKNQFNFVALESTQSYMFSTGLYIYDLQTDEFRNVSAIEKISEHNRIIDFIEFNEDNYVYIEAVPNKENGDVGETEFFVFRLKNGQKELITYGISPIMWATPNFIVLNEEVYLGFSNNDNGVDEATQIWKFTESESELVYKTGKGSESMIQSIYLKDSEVRFVVRRPHEYVEIMITNNQIKEKVIWKDIEENQFAQIIPLTDSIMVSFFEEAENGNDDITNYVVTDKGQQTLKFQQDYVDSIHIGNYVFVIHDNSSGLAAITEDENTINIGSIPTVMPIAFRKWDDTKLLILTDETMQNKSKWTLLSLNQ